MNYERMILSKINSKISNPKRKKSAKLSPVIYQKKPCPKCGSSMIAEIMVSMPTPFENNAIEEEYNLHDIPVKFISPQDFKQYYSQYHLNSYCTNCHYEFYSKTQKIKRDDSIKEPETKKPEVNSTVQEIEDNVGDKPRSEKSSKLKRILSILKE